MHGANPDSFERIRDDAHAERVIGLVEGAAEWAVDAEDQAGLARRGGLCAAGGLAHLHRGEFSEAAALLRQAVADHSGAGAWEHAAQSAIYLGHAYIQQGQAVLAAGAYGRAVSIADKHAGGGVQRRARASQARALRQLGRLDEAALIYASLLADADAHDDPDGVAIWRLNAASTAIRQGEIERADSLLTAVEENLPALASPLEMDAWCRTMRVWLCVESGERAQALAMAERARPVVERYGQYDLVYSLDRASTLARGLPGGESGDRERAEEHLQVLHEQEIANGHLSRAVDVLDDLIDLAEAHADLQAVVRLYKRRAKLQAETFETVMHEHERLAALREEVSEARARGEREHLRAELLAVSNAHMAELDRQRRRLLLSTAHDLRSPLGALKLTIDLTRQHPVREMPHLLDDLEFAVDRMVSIVDQSLSEQAIFAGRSVGRVDQVELVDIVERVARGFDSIVGAKRLKLVLDVTGSIVADVDPVGWSRIVQNLISNAAKFSPSGGEIRVGLKVAEDAHVVVFSVEDQGPGLPPDLLAKGPEWGRRGEGSGVEGSGIGLVTVAGLADSFGGSLSLGRADGGGARVWVTLPLGG